MRRGRAVGSWRVVRKMESVRLAHVSGIVGPGQRERPSARRCDAPASGRATRVPLPHCRSRSLCRSDLPQTPLPQGGCSHRESSFDRSVNHRSPPARHRLAGEGMGVCCEGWRERDRFLRAPEYHSDINSLGVIPAKAGIHPSACAGGEMDPCLRRDDSRDGFITARAAAASMLNSLSSQGAGMAASIGRRRGAVPVYCVRRVRTIERSPMLVVRSTR
jgi:hypothetical protein